MVSCQLRGETDSLALVACDANVFIILRNQASPRADFLTKMLFGCLQHETFGAGGSRCCTSPTLYLLPAMISRDRIRDVLVRMGKLGITRDDLEESFIRGSGHGGQKVNKTSSTVRLRHVPTGIEVRCQEERSLSQNRYLARAELCNKLEARLTAARQSTRAAIAKKRRQQQKRSRAVKAEMTREKRRRSSTKAMRRPPSPEE